MHDHDSPATQVAVIPANSASPTPADVGDTKEDNTSTAQEEASQEEASEASSVVGSKCKEPEPLERPFAVSEDSQLTYIDPRIVALVALGSVQKRDDGRLIVYQPRLLENIEGVPTPFRNITTIQDVRAFVEPHFKTTFNRYGLDTAHITAFAATFQTSSRGVASRPGRRQPIDNEQEYSRMVKALLGAMRERCLDHKKKSCMICIFPLVILVCFDTQYISNKLSEKAMAPWGRIRYLDFDSNEMVKYFQQSSDTLKTVIGQMIRMANSTATIPPQIAPIPVPVFANRYRVGNFMLNPVAFQFHRMPVDTVVTALIQIVASSVRFRLQNNNTSHPQAAQPLTQHVGLPHQSTPQAPPTTTAPQRRPDTSIVARPLPGRSPVQKHKKRPASGMRLTPPKKPRPTTGTEPATRPRPAAGTKPTTNSRRAVGTKPITKPGPESTKWDTATPMPQNYEKAETDKCLTCIWYAARCRGTQLDEGNRCEQCQEGSGRGRGPRKCYWAVPEMNIRTYDQAREADPDGYRCPGNTRAGRSERERRRGQAQVVGVSGMGDQTEEEDNQSEDEQHSDDDEHSEDIDHSDDDDQDGVETEDQDDTMLEVPLPASGPEDTSDEILADDPDDWTYSSSDEHDDSEVDEVLARSASTHIEMEDAD